MAMLKKETKGMIFPPRENYKLGSGETTIEDGVYM